MAFTCMLCAVISTFLIYKIYKSISVDELVIEPPVYTNAGKWGPRRICKEGHFVVGMKLKIHRNRAGNEPLRSWKFHNHEEGPY